MSETLNLCPLCNSEAINLEKEIIDYAVSKEEFGIWSCLNCSLLFTNPRPAVSEISPYYDFDDYYSHTDEGGGLIANIYQKVKTHSIQQKIKQFSSLVPNQGNLLDYGCGTGELIHQSQSKGWRVTGIEPNLKARKIAQNKLPDQVFESLDMINTTDKYNIITLYHVLEHIHTLNETISNLTDKLKSKGFLLIAIPNPESPDSKFYGNYWAGWDVPRHLYHFTHQSLLAFAESHSLQLIKTSPLKFDSFYVSLLSEGYKNPNQNRAVTYSNAFFQGLLSNIRASRVQTPNYSSNLYIFQKP